MKSGLYRHEIRFFSQCHFYFLYFDGCQIDTHLFKERGRNRDFLSFFLFPKRLFIIKKQLVKKGGLPSHTCFSMPVAFIRFYFSPKVKGIVRRFSFPEDFFKLISGKSVPRNFSDRRNGHLHTQRPVSIYFILPEKSNRPVCCRE